MDISVFHLEAVCNVLVGQLTVIGINCGVHPWIFVAGSFQTIFCKQQTITQSCIGQRNGGCPWNSTWHISHAIMYDSIYFVNRVIMIGHMGGFTASALVNRYVNDNRTWTHFTQVGTTNDLWRFLARNQYTANDKICRFQCILDVYIWSQKYHPDIPAGGC